MDKLSDNAHLTLAAVTLAVVFTALTSGCDSAQAKSLAQAPQKPRYFGEEFAHAQQALNDKPAAEMPQAF
jgi:hypothetical protein